METRKFQSLVHYIIHECSDRPGQLGAVRLNKALWYADVIAFKLRGVSITGETYLKRQHGPVPKHILRTLEALAEQDAIAIVEPEYRFDTRKFIARSAPPSNALSDDERSIASSVLKAVLGYTANAISEMSHDVIWQAAGEGEEIPLHATLAGQSGEITEAVVDWATDAMAQHKAA